MANADRTLENAADAIAATLRKSDLFTNIQVTHATGQKITYRVEGHLEGDPNAEFVVELTVS